MTSLLGYEQFFCQLNVPTLLMYFEHDCWIASDAQTSRDAS